MATLVASWYDDMAPYVHGVATGTKSKAIVETCMEFCRNTFLWTGVLKCDSAENEDFSITADRNYFHLTAVADADGAGSWLDTNKAQIISIESVKCKPEKSDGTEMDDDQFYFLDPITKEKWDLRDEGNWIYREAAYPSAFYMDSARTLYLYPIPTEDSLKGLQITSYLEPIRDATSVPDFIYDNYFKTILDGALAILLKMPNQPWTNIDLGHQLRLSYLQSMSDDKQVATRGRTVRSLGVTPRRFV